MALFGRRAYPANDTFDLAVNYDENRLSGAYTSRTVSISTPTLQLSYSKDQISLHEI
jgi:hypothetical protein